MADGKVLLEVVVEGKNVKVVQREVEQVTDAVNDNTSAQDRNTKASRRSADAARAAGDAHNHFDRGLKGAAGTAGSGAKNFSKMRDAIGGSSSGLVGAYATLAANLFAATAAFGALQRAAQVEQLTQGLSALGAASGLAMGSLSKSLQESTGYAISFQDSMRQVAMVTSAGFDTSVIERLGSVAKNTSIALGRDLQDSMNRLVKGATKLEPELLDELGIMVRIDEASQKYAQSIGKNASQLTNFEKRQAFMNAVLEEGEKKFGAIGESVDANPYDRLSATLQELGTTVLNAFNVILKPIVGFLADSKLALAGLIAILSKGIIGQALPVLSQMAAATAGLALKTSQEAEAAKEAAKVEVESRKSSMASLESVIGARGKAIDTSLKESKSLEDLTKINDTLSRSIRARNKLPGQEEKIEALKNYQDELKKIIDLEAERLKKESSGGDTAIAARTSLLVSGSERLSSLDENASLGNYRDQFMGALDDAKQFREQMAETVNEGISLDAVKTRIVSAMSAAGVAIKTFGINSFNGIKTFVTSITIAGIKSAFSFAGIAAGAQRASIAITSFGNAAKIAIKGIFTAIPIIGQVLFFLDLLIQAVTWLFNLFRSDEGAAYSASLDEAAKTTEELTKNSKEVNSALLGTSKTITTQAQLIDAQANIVSTASSEFSKLKASQQEAAAAGAWWGTSVSKITDNLDTQIDSNRLLQKEFQNFTSEGGKSYFDLNTYIKENNLTEQEGLDIAEKFLEYTEKKTKAQQNFAKSIADTNEAFTQYINKLKVSTEYSALREKLSDSVKALEGVQNAADGYANTLTLVQGLSDQQLKFYGIKEQSDSFKEINKQAQALRTLDSIDIMGMEQKDAVVAVNQSLKTLGLEQIDITSSQKQIEEARLKAVEKTAERKGIIFATEKKLSDQITTRAAEELKIVEQLEKQTLAVTKVQNEQKVINELMKEQGFIGSENARKRDELQSASYKEQLSLIALEEKNQQRVINLYDEGTVDRLAAENKLSEIQGRRTVLLAQQANFERSGLLRAAEDRYANLQLMLKGEQEIVSILQKQLQLSNSILAGRISLQEVSMQVQNLQAGGDAALSARQQLQVFQQFEQDKKDNIQREYDLKIRTIQMEEKLNNAKLAILKADLLVKIKEQKDRQAELVTTQGMFGPDYLEAAGIVDSLTSAYKELTGLNYSQVAAAEQTQASVDKGVALETLKRDNLQNQRNVNAETRQTAVELIQAQIDLENVVGNIQEKIYSSRSSILDNERTIRENELKAINLRNKGIGEYDLTAQQTLQLEMEFGEKKKALLREEESIKLKMIGLEYDLLAAQLEVQKAALIENLNTQKTRDPSKTESIDARIATVNGVFDRAFALLPQAAQAAAAATRSETEAAVSEITSAQIQAQEAVFGWTQKMTTSWEDISTAIGQNFLKTLQDAKSITQELADIFSNAVNSAVDSFVDAIIEGKNAFQAIGSAVRDSLRNGLAEAAKNKLKEGIAGLFSAAEMGEIAEVFKTPQDKAIEATQATTKAITETAKSHTELLQRIADNTAKCCMGGSGNQPPPTDLGVKAMPIEDWAKGKTIQASSANSNSSLVKPKVVLDPKNDPFNNGASKAAQDMEKLNKKSFQLNGQTYSASKDTSVNTANTVKEVGFWGKASEYATNNVGTIAAAGFAQMAAALAAGASPKKALLGGILGAVGGAIGGAVGGPAGAMIGSQIGGMVGSSFAKGGVMSSSGPMPLQKYADGGIARTPQLAMFGEGSRPEAYVPLPDGRTIPVTMSNGGGNVNNISVNVAVDGSGSATTSTNSKDTTEEYSRKLGTAISNAVKQEIFNQQRPGGLLYKGRR